MVQYVLWAQWWGACLGEACLLWVAQWECRDAPEESWEGWLQPRWSGAGAGVFRAIVDMKKRRRKATAALNKKVLGWALEVDASLSQPRLRIDCLATVRVTFEVEVGAGGKAH